MSTQELKLRRLSIQLDEELNDLPTEGLLNQYDAHTSTLQRIYLYFKEHKTTIVSGLLFIALNLIVFILLIIYHNPVFEALEKLAMYLKSLGPGGIMIPSLLMVLTAFPLVPGYGTLTVLCGFVYGFPLGFVPAFLGGVIGASLCFLLARYLGAKYVRKFLKGYSYIESVLQAIEIEGFPLLLLIRIAPYPWNVLNLFLSITSVSFRVFISATAISLIKLFIHVYIGSTLKTLMEGLGSRSPFYIIVVIFGGLLGLGVTVYIYLLCKRRINETLQKSDKSSDIILDEFDLEPNEIITSDEHSGLFQSRPSFQL